MSECGTSMLRASCQRPRVCVARVIAAIGASVLLLNLIPPVVRADPAGADSLGCAAWQPGDFQDAEDAPARIVEAKEVGSRGAVPAYCDVQGYIAPQVGFAIRLPASHWNGKFLMVGCGGTCGVLFTEIGVCDVPLQRGYACIATDMGHRGSGAAWAYHNLQAEIDFAYRATHVTALVGKAIVQRHYRVAPKKSYFMGCSTGGRQGLAAAQRFPGDFDGIVAGAPVTSLAATTVYLLEAVRAARGTTDDPVLPPSTLKLLHDSVLARCDLDDGVKDGVVGDPMACRVDPSELACRSGTSEERCLNDAQIAAAQRLYAGVVRSNGERLAPGAAAGSELAWTDHLAESATKRVTELLRYMLFMPDAGPMWQLSEFDVERDFARLMPMDALYSASNPDLRRFKAAGGKLIVYQGWIDPLLVPASTIDYYETAERTLGGRRATQDFLRLFMLPGVGHCAGGAGADAVDFLGYLEAWVERGQAPDEILAAHARDGSRALLYPYRQFPADKADVSFTRPVYPYPRRALYRGRGDPHDASSFRASESP